MNLLNFVYLKSINKKLRFFSSNSKNFFINNLNLPEVDERILSSYSYNYFNIQDCLRRVNLVVVHNRNYYINVSVWHQTESDVLNCLNSPGFQQILVSHEQKFGTQLCGWYYFDKVNSILWVHPLLSIYFVPIANKQLRIEIFGSGELVEPTYEQLCGFFPSEFLEKHPKINTLKSTTSNFLYQVPQMELYLVTYLKHKLQMESWSSFNFQHGFFCFTAGKNEGWYALRPILYVGKIKVGSNLKKTLDVVIRYYKNVKLLGVVKFYNNYDGQLNNFEKIMVNKLHKINKPFKNQFKSALNLTAFPNISETDFRCTIFPEYYANFHYSCAMCPPKFIECFNNNFSSLDHQVEYEN